MTVCCGGGDKRVAKRKGRGGSWWVSGPKHCPAGRDQKVVVASSERQSGGFKQPVK